MRIPKLTPEQMTSEQRDAHDEAARGRRGHAPAPMMGWLSSPELARRAQHLGEFLRYGTTLPPDLTELAILVTARAWTSHYEWFAHKKLALQAGLPPAVIDAIARREQPSLPDPKAKAVYDVSTALHGTRTLPQPVYDAAFVALGQRGLTELIGLLGYYTLVSMTLNAYEFDVPEGEPLDLAG